LSIVGCGFVWYPDGVNGLSPEIGLAEGIYGWATLALRLLGLSPLLRLQPF